MLITVQARRAAHEGSEEEAVVQGLAPPRLRDARRGHRGLTAGAVGVRPGARRERWLVLGLCRGAARTTVSKGCSEVVPAWMVDSRARVGHVLSWTHLPRHGGRSIL